MNNDIASRFTTTQRPEISKKRKKRSLASGDLKETVADYPVGDHYHAFTNPHFYESRHAIRCL